MKKLCSVDKCQYIPLLYTEGMLFLSLYCKSTNEKCSIVDATPSLLLNLCCIQEGFSSIQQHIRKGLIYPSNAMGSDPIYICHYYDIMANLARNDKRIVMIRSNRS